MDVYGARNDRDGMKDASASSLTATGQSPATVDLAHSC